MNCTEFERILDESIEARRPADSEPMRRHAARCANCGTRWQQYAILERVIPLWKDRTPSVDLVDAVLAKVAFDPREMNNVAEVSGGSAAHVEVAGGPVCRDALGSRVGRSSRPVNSRQMTAVLAVVATALLLLVRMAAVPTHVDQDWTAAVNRAADVGDVGADLANGPEKTNRSPAFSKSRTSQSSQFETLLRDAGSAYLGLARGAAEAVADATVLVASANRLGMDMGIDEAAPDATSSWIDQWGRELQPIGRDLGNAVDFLFDAIPPETAPKS